MVKCKDKDVLDRPMLHEVCCSQSLISLKILCTYLRSLLQKALNSTNKVNPENHQKIPKKILPPIAEYADQLILPSIILQEIIQMGTSMGMFGNIT